ncbi:MAG TPA: thioredoxin domain-containing protein [Spirochaetota bacterium]|nr:thioredoxin domain-containing protein [Spirochaetota bacterium]
MKKYINLMLLLSVAGVFISGLLLYQHYFPEFEMGFLSCGKGFSNPCIAVGQSRYSIIFGLPVASYGLLYFILIAFLILVADYAQDKYYKILCGIVFPLIIAGLVSDVILGILMIKIGELCKLCILTYLINVLLFITMFLFIKNNFIKIDIKESLKKFFKPDASDEKASLSLSILFAFFLAFAVFTSTNIIKMKSGINKTPDGQRSKLLTNFYNQEQEQINFIPSNLTIGRSDAKLKIYIFNDFLCSACYKLYQIEKFIIAKYKNNIQIVYYHYPLDKGCNKYMDDTVYPNSCLASQTMYAASEAGFFEEYFYVHFSDYQNYKDGFEKENVKKNLDQANKQFKIKPEWKQKFEALVESSEGSRQISEHIEFAEKLKIEATPTIIISGRKIVGVPPKELLESIIETELSK